MQIPSLKLRKDIWSRFPVCLLAHPSTDGRDRWAIHWQQDQLEKSLDSLNKFQNAVKKSLIRYELLEALKQSDKWTVEPSTDPKQICIIAMIVPEEPKIHTNLPALFAPSPKIERLEDLGKFFPVCWKEEGNRVHLEFHRTLLRSLSLRYSMPESELERLTREKLALYSPWTLEPPSRRNELFQILRLDP